jgi:predicted transcriptional regulator
MTPVTGSGERRRRGALEQQVLGCLAVAAGPMTPAEVQEALGGDLAYTTVMTTLTRLFDKGALSREAAGRAYRYRLAGDPSSIAANVTAHQMHRLLAGSDREQVLSRFVADLQPGDEELLMGLLSKTAVEEPAAEPPAATKSKKRARS